MRFYFWIKFLRLDIVQIFNQTSGLPHSKDPHFRKSVLDFCISYPFPLFDQGSFVLINVEISCYLSFIIVWVLGQIIDWPFPNNNAHFSSKLTTGCSVKVSRKRVYFLVGPLSSSVFLTSVTLIFLHALGLLKSGNRKLRLAELDWIKGMIGVEKCAPCGKNMFHPTSQSHNLYVAHFCGNQRWQSAFKFQIKYD